MRARLPGTCPGCTKDIKVDQAIRMHGGSWHHIACADALRARALVTAGTTFAGTRPEYRRRVRRRD